MKTLLIILLVAANNLNLTGQNQLPDTVQLNTKEHLNFWEPYILAYQFKQLGYLENYEISIQLPAKYNLTSKIVEQWKNRPSLLWNFSDVLLTKKKLVLNGSVNYTEGVDEPLRENISDSDTSKPKFYFLVSINFNKKPFNKSLHSNGLKILQIGDLPIPLPASYLNHKMYFNNEIAVKYARHYYPEIVEENLHYQYFSAGNPRFLTKGEEEIDEVFSVNTFPYELSPKANPGEKQGIIIILRNFKFSLLDF